MFVRSCTIIVTAGFLLIALSAVPAAEARTTCRYHAHTKLLTVKTTGESIGELKRDGRSIQVSEFLERPAHCKGGTPTVRNTDAIRIVSRDSSFVELQLDGGPFAPGASPERNGAPEIEIEEIERGWLGGISIHGTDHADYFRYGIAGGHAGINLNARRDRDIDLVDVGVTDPFLGPLIDVETGAGRDVVRPVHGMNAKMPGGIEVQGGRGDDLLVGARSHDWLLGNRGDDRILGGRGPDHLTGGPGRDLIAGGGSHDTIWSTDFRADRVKCGGGQDTVKGADPEDRLSDCEQIHLRR